MKIFLEPWDVFIYYCKTAIPLLTCSELCVLSPKYLILTWFLYIFGVSSAVVKSCCNLSLSYVSFSGPRCVCVRWCLCAGVLVHVSAWSVC